MHTMCWIEVLNIMNISDPTTLPLSIPISISKTFDVPFLPLTLTILLLLHKYDLIPLIQ